MTDTLRPVPDGADQYASGQLDTFEVSSSLSHIELPIAGELSQGVAIELGVPESITPHLDGIVWDMADDNIGKPDFSGLVARGDAERKAALTKIDSLLVDKQTTMREPLTRLGSALAAREAVMRTADFYLKEGSLEYPKDFKEPPSFALNAEEWAKYSERKSTVDAEQQRREEVKRRFMLGYQGKSADAYLVEGATDLPWDDYREPEPFVLDAREWAIYKSRRDKIAA